MIPAGVPYTPLMRTPCVLVLLAAALSSGCGSSDRVARTNDRLRLEREALRDRVAALEAELAETRAKLVEATERSAEPLPKDIVDALPRVATLEIGRLSLIEPGRAVVFVTPRDGRGRFVQAVGTLEVRVIGLGEAPALLGSRTVPPTELRDAFAAGLTGATYRIEVPLDASPHAGVTLEAVLHDHLTGVAHQAERSMPAGE